MNTATVLIVDDTKSDLFFLQGHLEDWGYTPLLAYSGVEALKVLNNHAVDLIVSDQEMEEMDGIELLKQVKRQIVTIPFIMLTAHGDITKAVTAMKYGADDYLSKNEYDPAQFQAKIARLLGYRVVQEKPPQEFQAFRDILTTSHTMKNVFTFALKVAKNSRTTVLIEGESGTGKGLLAMAIHRISVGARRPFIHVNCATIPADLLESELFGYVKGAFTGADRDKPGKFGAARGGTLLLDEISEMRLDLQAKLLRALQERTYEPVGSNKKHRINCRVICTTNQSLRDMLAKGEFREDLYYRITGFPITMPPLRERKEDIPLLAAHFLKRFQHKNLPSPSGISEQALQYLIDYDWPGNVRELENCIERAVILTEKGPIRPSHLQAIPQTYNMCDASGGTESRLRLDQQTIQVAFTCRRDQFSLDTVINQTLRVVLKMCDNNVSEAAKVLKVGRKMFYRRGILAK